MNVLRTILSTSARGSSPSDRASARLLCGLADAVLLPVPELRDRPRRSSATTPSSSRSDPTPAESPGIHAHFSSPRLITTTVTTVSAMAASSWLAMPNSGNSVLMPPSGSVTPISRMPPHAATTMMLQIHAPTRQLGSLQLAQRTAEVAEAVGEHESRDARAGVDGGEDEQRLEHDREVVPERLQALAAEDLVQHLGHAERQRRCAAGAGDDGLLADIFGGLR